MVAADNQESGDGLREAACDLGDLGEGDGSADELTQLIIGPIMPPSMALLPTVLVTELDSGELVIQGRPDGPRVYLSPDDAVPLKRELARAFGSSALTHYNNRQDEAQ